MTTLLAYLRSNLTLPGEQFVKIFAALSERDGAELKQYARDEMTVLGITIDEKR